MERGIGPLKEQQKDPATWCCNPKNKSDLPLTATSSGNTTCFLYGRGPIGEKTATWNDSLLDGTNTPAYDALNRPANATYGDGESYSYTYVAFSFLLS